MTKEKIFEKIKKIVYYCYVVLMPFLIPSFFTNKFHLPYLLGMSSIFLFLGLILIIFSTKSRSNIKEGISKLKIFIIYFALTTITSLIMCTIISFQDVKIEGMLFAVVKQICFNAYSLLIIFYNYIMLKEISFKPIIKILWYESIVCIFICLLQVLCMKFMFAIKVFDLFNFLGILRPGEYYMELGRITGFGYEPSAFTSFSVFVSLPIFLSCVMSKQKILLNTLLAGLTIVCAYFTKSSAVYICLFCVLGVFILCLISKLTKTKNKKLFIFISLISLVFISVFLLVGWKEIVRLFLKMFDLKHESTVYRYSTVYNDILCFFKYPIWGVGNGLQGLFYNSHINGTLFTETQSLEIIEALNGNKGILSGGGFIPSVLSGYGILGIGLLCYIAFISIRTIRKVKFYNNFYFMSMISFLLGSCVAYELTFNYIALFFITIPFVLTDKKINVNIKENRQDGHVK